MTSRCRRLRGILWPRSVAARSTLAAALTAAVALTLGAWWVRHEAYQHALLSLEQAVAEELPSVLQQTATAAATPGSPPLLPQIIGGYPYEIVDTSGNVRYSAPTLQPFERSGPLGRVPHGEVWPRFLWYPVHLAVPFGPPRNPDEWDSMIALGTTTTVTARPSATAKPSSEILGVTVFGFTQPADQALADVDRVLYPGVPAAVLLVAGVAYLATRRALRPVEAIRARTAAVTAADPRERVDVPRTGDAIERLATTINGTLERLDDAARAQRRFVADAAHELRSPLTTLLATLEVAETYPERADWPQVASVATGQARRVHALSEDLLLLARLDAGAPAPIAVVDLGEVAAGVAGEYGDQVVCDVAGPAPVVGAAGRLERLLRNLLDNAVRHAAAGVEVRVRADGGEVVLEVADDGPGIPPADRERVFERFTRLDDARARDTGGAGLGLAIVRDIAARHGGTAEVADSARGALLVVRLPRASSA